MTLNIEKVPNYESSLLVVCSDLRSQLISMLTSERSHPSIALHTIDRTARRSLRNRSRPDWLIRASSRGKCSWQHREEHGMTIIPSVLLCHVRSAKTGVIALHGRLYVGHSKHNLEDSPAPPIRSYICTYIHTSNIGSNSLPYFSV